MPTDDDYEREWQTRRKRIDTRLTALGWKVAPCVPGRPLAACERHALTEYPTANGPADYALIVGGRVLGIVEAKKLTLGPQNVLSQAERYSRGLAGGTSDFHGHGVPFLYSTNGEALWFHDVRHALARSRRIAQFHTPAALSELITRDFDADCAWFAANANDHERLRPYQRDANTAIEKGIADRKRAMLVAMATGTGKTFTTVNQAYRLMMSGVARRVLFLVDRKALAVQAVRAFASYEPEPGLKFDKVYEVYSQRFRREEIEDDGDAAKAQKFDPKVLPEAYLLDPKPAHAFVYVCTIQRMAINLFGREAAFEQGDDLPDEDEAEKLDIPIHAFDVIVADECHRGYTASEGAIWRRTLDHFDAIKVGLTATPAAHTAAYFGPPVFTYRYEQAVLDGHLVDYDAVTIRSGVRMNGVFLREGEQISVVDPVSGAEQMDQLEDERQFEATDIERKITVLDSNRKIVAEYKKYADAHVEQYGRFPKTLFFAANDLPHGGHADQPINLLRDAFGRGDSFVAKITGSPTVDRPLQRIREFRNRPNPAIVVSVDLMSTGVDIPDLEMIVFLRPVKSRILFAQMIGRGTRKGDKYPDKSHFTVFDCFDGTLLAYFRNSVDVADEPPDKPTRPLEDVIEDVWQNKDRAYNVKRLVKRFQRIAKEVSGATREQLAGFIPDGDLGQFAKGLTQALSHAFTPTMNVLRNKEFQNILIKHKPAKRGLIVDGGTVDDVSSQWLIRDGNGREYRPEDYLSAFARFVKENSAHVEAIRILLERPKDWSTAALNELRQKLAMQSPRFTVDDLQKAHQVRYHKALADIISMVKHAAKEQEPLLTAAERVKRAVEKVTSGQTLTDEQTRWMELVRSHLEISLSVDRDDFDLIPALSREGGWGAANKAFGGRLGTLLAELNEAVAASCPCRETCMGSQLNEFKDDKLTRTADPSPTGVVDHCSPARPLRVEAFAAFFKRYMGLSTVVAAALPIPATAFGAIPTYSSQTGSLAVFTSLFCFLMLSFAFYTRHGFARLAFYESASRAANDSAVRRLLMSWRGIASNVRALPLLLIAAALACLFFYLHLLSVSIGLATTHPPQGLVLKWVEDTRSSLEKLEPLARLKATTQPSMGVVGVSEEFLDLSDQLLSARAYLNPSYRRHDVPLYEPKPPLIHPEFALKNTPITQVPYAGSLMIVYLGIFVCAETAFILMALREFLQDVLGLSEQELLREPLLLPASRPSIGKLDGLQVQACASDSGDITSMQAAAPSGERGSLLAQVSPQADASSTADGSSDVPMGDPVRPKE